MPRVSRASAATNLPASRIAGGVASVERALSVVAAFAASTSPLTLAELARATGLYNSTVLRLLVSLERGGYVVRGGDGRYGLGTMAFRLGLAYERSHGLKTHLLPILQELVQLGCESPSFHVRHDTKRRLCLLRLDSRHATLDRVHAGDLLPLDRGAAGRVILAAEATPQPSLVLASFGERDPACASVACPVFGPNGMLVGALSLSGPLDRFTQETVAAMSRPLLRAAIVATRALGGDLAALLAEQTVMAAAKRQSRHEKTKEQIGVL